MSVQTRPQPRESRLPRFLRAVLHPEHPGSVVYGTTAVGLVLAAENPAEETYPRVLAATMISVVLYWLAHAYSEALGARFRRRLPLSAALIGSTLRREFAIVEGALPALVVLALCWLLGVSLASAVWADVLTVVGCLVVFEVVAGVRAKLGIVALLMSAAFGGVLGLALIAIKALLHH